jgi:hypothetical protein
MEPCLFEYATKELSQDAFFCWLLAWSDDTYKDNDLNKVASNLINYITSKRISVKKVEIYRQYKGIDFYIRINEKTGILFEDKIKTSFHDNQLDRYKKAMSEQFPNDELYFVYIKNGLIFPNEKLEVEGIGFRVIDIYGITYLLKYNIDNDIFRNYVYHIKTKINRYENFDKIKYDLWRQDEWYGFIYRLINFDFIEYDDYGLWQGRELWLMLNASDYIDNKDYWVSLEIKHSLANNTGRLTVLLHIEDDELNKSLIKRNVINKIIKIFVDESIETNNRTGNLTSVITFTDFPIINSNGYIDYLKNKNFIIKIKNDFAKIMKQ